MAQTVTIPISDHDSECTAFYLVEYKFTGDPGYTFSQQYFDSPIVVNNLADAASYDFRITRQCCNGATGTPTTFTVDTTPVPVPSLFSATQDGADVDLAWTDMSVDEYELQRVTDVDFTTGLTELYTGATNSFTDLAVPAGSYWYRVRSILNGVASEWIVDSLVVV